MPQNVKSKTEKRKNETIKASNKETEVSVFNEPNKPTVTPLVFYGDKKQLDEPRESIASTHYGSLKLTGKKPSTGKSTFSESKYNSRNIVASRTISHSRNMSRYSKVAQSDRIRRDQVLSTLSNVSVEHRRVIPPALFRNPHATSMFANDLMRGFSY
jgi:hypothetical protein